MSKINIGAVIKKLRQERGMVQEQIAEYLNVSTQAVSRWETGSALPDITQVPALANLFNCSADMLLGVDIAAKEEHIEKVEKEAGNYLLTGQYEEAEKILRGALKEYPNSYKLMAILASTLKNIAWNTKAETEKKALNEEVIALGEKILEECTDDKTRYNAIRLLCYTYCNIGETEKAMNLANKLPDKGVTSDYLRGYILKGTEKFKHKQRQIANDMAGILEEIINLNYNLLDGEIAAYNPDEFAVLHSKVIDIINILCEDGNFGYFNFLLSHAYHQLYYFNIKKQDNDAALKHFKLAAKHAILFDAIPRNENEGTEEEYKNLLFRGMKVGFIKVISPNNSSQFLLERIESENLYSRFPSEELDAIKEELQKHAVLH